MYRQLGVIGCGLIGGSFALAMKHAGLARRVVGYSRTPATTALALRLGTIDEAADSAAGAVAGCDIVFIAVPVAATEATLKSIRQALEPGVLLMDAGSTKRDVVDAARRTLRERIDCFVPAHPIAGKESSGVEHAEATLFVGRQVILTPLPQTDTALLKRAGSVWQSIGAELRTMSAEEHDTRFAAVSHLPHLLAFAFFSTVADQPAGDEFLALAGPGFRDFTRIAASDPAIWRDILSANREEVLKQSQQFRATLDSFETAMRLGQGTALEALIRGASEGRAEWRMGEPPKRPPPEMA
jgi:prephenate dehydrogenase